MLDAQVVPWPWKPKENPEGDCVVLEQDSWNDFGFYTLYGLYVFVDETWISVGQVRILRMGQKEGEKFLLELGPLRSLGANFCSIGTGLDYYESLGSLKKSTRDKIVALLRDSVAYSEDSERFFQEPGWKSSLMRNKDWETFRVRAYARLYRRHSNVEGSRLEMKFEIAGWATPISFRLSAPRSDDYGLPKRIAVIVGRNGSGKSTLLARIARILHASKSDRERFGSTSKHNAGGGLLSFGTVEPGDITFTRIVNISYSAFDAFQLPGIDDKERGQAATDLELGGGDFQYCGVRDIAAEFRSGLHKESGKSNVGLELRAVNPGDHQRRTLLKSTDKLASEFSNFCKEIESLKREEIFHKVINILRTEPSIQDLGSDLEFDIFESPRGLFSKWSTGHKIVMHATAAIVAYVDSKSILLIDEPESHLHPPLLAAFMHAIREILNKMKSFAIVATHSPVVVQETLGQNVSIVRKSGDVIEIEKPEIETFGESIGIITSEVFGYGLEAADYHNILCALAEGHKSLEEVEEKFELGLSMQARAFIHSEFSRKE